MASSSFFLSSPLPSFPAPAHRITENTQRVPTIFLLPYKPLRNISAKPRTLIAFSTLAESNSSKSLGGDGDGDGNILPLLQELAASFSLPPDFLAKLPRDLRMDLNDAAFDLSNGPVMDECGQELGELLLNLSRAWEQADTTTSNSLAGQLPSLESSLRGNVKPAFGRRLMSAGRRFVSMGQYGQGELQRIAKAMMNIGKVLSSSPEVKTDEKPEEETRVFKFGDLQVALTSEKAYIGAAIAVVFGFLSWELSQGIQSIPESSLQYSNDNALMLGKSLRGALLLIGYASTILSAFSAVGLMLLGRELTSGRKPEDP